VEEILDAQRAGCPPEYFNIPIPKGNPLFDPDGHGGRELPFLRTRYDMRTGRSPHAPREQVGDIINTEIITLIIIIIKIIIIIIILKTMPLGLI